MKESESNFSKRQPSPQAVVSSIVATLLLAQALMLLEKQVPSWGQIINREHNAWRIVAPVIAAPLAISGWLYVLTRKVTFGIVHSLLMCVVAGAGGYFGVWPLLTHDYPTESLVALVLMAYAAIGVVALVCVVGMVFDLRHIKNDN